MASYWPPHDCWANPPAHPLTAPQIRSKRRCHNHHMKTCIFTLLTTCHHVLLYLCTELFHVISAEVVAQFISSQTACILLWAFQTVQHGFFSSSSSSPFQNYQLFPDHLAEAHTVGPYSPPGSGGLLEVHRVAAAQKSSRSSIISTPSFRLLPEDSCPDALPLLLLILPDCRAQYFQTSVIGWLSPTHSRERTHTHRDTKHTFPDACLATLWTPIHHAKIALTFKKCKLFFGGEIFILILNFPWFAQRELQIHRAVCSERLRNHCRMVLKGKKEWRILSNDSSIFHEATLCNVSSENQELGTRAENVSAAESRRSRPSLSSLSLTTNMSA